MSTWEQPEEGSLSEPDRSRPQGDRFGPERGRGRKQWDRRPGGGVGQNRDAGADDYAGGR